MKAMFKVFVRGLVVFLPIAFTVYILAQVAGLFDSLLSPIIKTFVAEERYQTGTGILLLIVLVFLIGLFIEAWAVRVFFDWAADLLDRIPLVKSIYGSLRDLMGFLSAKDRHKAKQVVLVKAGLGDIRMLGLVTRDDLSESPLGGAGRDMVAVFIPLSYAMGGFTTIVPRSAVELVDMTAEEAMRFAVTAGMSTGANGNGDGAVVAAPGLKH